MSLFTSMLVPAILALAGLRGLWKNMDVCRLLSTGAEEGLRILLRILPNLICLLTAIAMLRASGFLEWTSGVMAPVLSQLGIPSETAGLLLVRPMSGSGALGLGAELIQRYGPDSSIGRTAAVMLGSTETTFYTVSVYFGAAKIHKTRYAIPAALCADLVGFIAAAWAVRLFFPTL